MKIVKPSVKLLWVTPDSEKRIEEAGRTCYKSEDKITNDSARQFAEQMRNRGHHAMLEHSSASFRIITDRGITHEIVRHRLASYAQESTRYCNYGMDKFKNECSFIEPPGLSQEQNFCWRKACGVAEEKYFDMLLMGCSPQIARSVLPNCLKTEIVMTTNFREWRHFITLRIAKTAHPQIRPLAQSILKTLFVSAPSVFMDLNPTVKQEEDQHDKN